MSILKALTTKSISIVFWAVMLMMTATSSYAQAANTAPVADAGIDQTVASGATVKLNGTKSTDPDGDSIKYFWSTTEDDITINNPNSATPTFTAPSLSVVGKAREIVLTLVVTDNSESKGHSTVKITVNPAVNRAPNADAGSDQTVVSGSDVSLNGSGSNDNDPGDEIVTYSWTVDNNNITIINPKQKNASFKAPTLKVTDPKVEIKATLTVTDRLGKTDTDEVKITVNPPANTAPIADAGTDKTVASGSNVTLDGTNSRDPDRGDEIKTYSWTAKGVTIKDANSKNASFTAPELNVNADPVKITVTLTVTDTLGKSDTDDVIITVNPAKNREPIAVPGENQTVVSGSTVNLDGSKSYDPDTGDRVKTYTWKTDTQGVTITSPNSAKTSFIAPTLKVTDSPLEVVLTLVVTDLAGEKGSKTVKITVTPPGNRKPIADAGSDQTVYEDTRITLDGTKSRDPDAGDEIKSYEWTSEHRGLRLTDANTATPTFTTPEINVYGESEEVVLKLTVTDRFGLKGTDEIRFTVTPRPNNAPEADAGKDQTVNSGSLVELDGSKSSDSDRGDSIVTYSWVGEGLNIENANTAKPKFTAPTINVNQEPRDYTVRLTVTDRLGLTDTDDVVIRVNPSANKPPVAVPGEDQTVASGAKVRLDGSKSYDPDTGDAVVSYLWSTVSKDVTISGDDTQTPSFIAPKLGVAETSREILVTLVVTDRSGSKDAESVRITVTPPKNRAPKARAGDDQTVDSGARVTLNGSASSDPDTGDAIVSYEWTAPGLTISGANTPTPSFTVPTIAYVTDDPLEFVVTLKVTDKLGATGTDTVKITVNPPANNPPEPDAGENQTVASGARVQLDGSRSYDQDRNDEVASYEWVVETGNVTLENANTARPSFTAPTLKVTDDPYEIVLRMTISDKGGLKSRDKVTITVNPAENTAPVSNPGFDQTVPSGSTVKLDGSRSYDPDENQGDRIKSYEWYTKNNDVVILNANSKTPTFVAPEVPFGYDPVQIIVTLTVTDTFGERNGDTVKITVNPSSTNTAPIADAGPAQTVESGSRVVLDASASYDRDANDRVTEIEWELDDKSIVLENASRTNANFDAPIVTETTVITATVTVRDTEGLTDTDEVKITVKPQVKIAPIADAGSDLTVDSGSRVVLNGTGSNQPVPGVRITQVEWKLDDTNIVVSSANTLTANFDAPIVTETTVITATITVTDTQGLTDTDEVKITVKPLVNNAPVANAGSNQTVVSGAAVTLDGSKSTDSDKGDEITYAWEQTAGFIVNLSDKSAAKPTFTAPTVAANSPDQELTFTLTVKDKFGLESTSSVVVTVTAEEDTQSTGGDGDSDTNDEAKDAANKAILEPMAKLQVIRNDQWINRQPGLNRRFGRNGKDEVNFTPVYGPGLSFELNYTAGGSSNFWSQGSFSFSKTEETKYNYGLFSAGYDSKLNDNLLLGMLVQYDRISSENNIANAGQNVKGNGLMAGPYIVVTAPDSSFYLEGRMLYGYSWNSVKVDKTAKAEDVNSTRMLAQLKIENEIELGKLSLRPNLTASYASDKTVEFKNSKGIQISAQDIKTLQVDVGSKFDFNLDKASKIYGGVGYIWSSNDANGDYAKAFIDSQNGGRTAVEFGYQNQFGPGASLDFSVFYDGLGTEDFSSYGAQATIQIGF